MCPGCITTFSHFRSKPAGRWERNVNVVPCSDKVESGTFFGPSGGHLMAFKKFRVGLDFDVTMQIKPRNVSGVLLAIQVTFGTLEQR